MLTWFTSHKATHYNDRKEIQITVFKCHNIHNYYTHQVQRTFLLCKWRGWFCLLCGYILNIQFMRIFIIVSWYILHALSLSPLIEMWLRCYTYGQAIHDDWVGFVTARFERCGGVSRWSKTCENVPILSSKCKWFLCAVTSPSTSQSNFSYSFGKVALLSLI